MKQASEFELIETGMCVWEYVLDQLNVDDRYTAMFKAQGLVYTREQFGHQVGKVLAIYERLREFHQEIINQEAFDVHWVPMIVDNLYCGYEETGINFLTLEGTCNLVVAKIEATEDAPLSIREQCWKNLEEDDDFRKDADRAFIDVVNQLVEFEEDEELEVPDDFPVKVLGSDEHPPGRATCGTCGRSWDDDISTTWTPVPSGRCPFEYYHNYEAEEEEEEEEEEEG